MCAPEVVLFFLPDFFLHGLLRMEMRILALDEKERKRS